MLGVADLVHALATKTAPRASGELALHVLEVMEAILASGEGSGAIRLDGASGNRPRCPNPRRRISWRRVPSRGQWPDVTRRD